MTFFLVIDLVLWIFPFFSHIFRIFTMLNVVYDPFLTRKTPFFTLFILSSTSDNTTSQNIGGDECMGCPPTLNFGGPSPPRFPPLNCSPLSVHGNLVVPFARSAPMQTHSFSEVGPTTWNGLPIDLRHKQCLFSIPPPSQDCSFPLGLGWERL